MELISFCPIAENLRGIGRNPLSANCSNPPPHAYESVICSLSQLDSRVESEIWVLLEQVGDNSHANILLDENGHLQSMVIWRGQ